MKFFQRFMKNEEGATAIEYGLIAALISVAIIGAAGTVGDNLSATFTEVGGSLQQAGEGGEGGEGGE